MTSAAEAWAALSDPWHVALDEAWASWCAGSAGVGAAVVDPGGDIVSLGRNRIGDERVEPGILAGTFLAHAEMNALAVMPLGATDDCSIYTTFEPCLMCASTIVQHRIAEVHYASPDPVFAGLHDWFVELPWAADRLPRRFALGGPVGAFCHVLHVSWLAFWLPEGPIMDAHRNLAPGHLELAQAVNAAGTLAEVRTGEGSVVDALASVWTELTVLAPSPE